MSWPRVFFHHGATLAERRELAQKHGHTLNVILQNPLPAAAASAPETSITADAVVDTGASCICVDKRIVMDLRLQRTSPTNVIAVGASHPAFKYAARVIVPELDFDKIMDVTAPDGARVAPRILLGRSFLENFVFSFNGPEGTMTVHRAADEAPVPHDFDE